jgi:hypothetical protein
VEGTLDRREHPRTGGALNAGSRYRAAMDETVRRLAADSGVLRRIAGRRSAASYAFLELTFERGTLCLTSDADTDEIVVRVDAAVASDSDEIVDDPVLDCLLGKVIEHAWMMCNDRGYEDGFQLRCLDVESRHEGCCQFEVGASAITVARVSG